MSAHRVQVVSIPAGSPGVKLPNGGTYVVGDTPTLTDEQFSQLNSKIFSDNILSDLGEIGGASGAVTVQGASVTLLGTGAVATVNATDLPTAQALANALKTAHNLLATDVANLRAALSGVGKALLP